jgi:hypothetical protein
MVKLVHFVPMPPRTISRHQADMAKSRRRKGGSMHAVGNARRDAASSYRAYFEPQVRRIANLRDRVPTEPAPKEPAKSKP